MTFPLPIWVFLWTSHKSMAVWDSVEPHIRLVSGKEIYFERGNSNPDQEHFGKSSSFFFFFIVNKIILMNQGGTRASSKNFNGIKLIRSQKGNKKLIIKQRKLTGP